MARSSSSTSNSSSSSTTSTTISVSFPSQSNSPVRQLPLKIGSNTRPRVELSNRDDNRASMTTRHTPSCNSTSLFVRFLLPPLLLSGETFNELIDRHSPTQSRTSLLSPYHLNTRPTLIITRWASLLHVRYSGPCIQAQVGTKKPSCRSGRKDTSVPVLLLSRFFPIGRCTLASTSLHATTGDETHAPCALQCGTAPEFACLRTLRDKPRREVSDGTVRQMHASFIKVVPPSPPPPPPLAGPYSFGG